MYVVIMLEPKWFLFKHVDSFASLTQFGHKTSKFRDTEATSPTVRDRRWAFSYISI